ncbi:hypothetical protein SISNIDRAFT_331847 [Sistotremastrum niveocremeum HHB9708]|uniref:Adipose-regulatory protein n=1 Tax=Sistotremastrum niveocremeum HHB9708 TaxID=1314777 RepID=A0A164XGK1_9AGAM|nr:hypothetical protein SISNIDRAFT_331847 [Sistotremastrum niveocremeum HHB9708]
MQAGEPTWMQTIYDRLKRTLYFLLPVVICAGLLPVLAFFSVGAGYTVWSSVPHGWSVEAFLQYGDGRSPYARVHLPPLITDQAYDVSLQLSVPTIPSNLELGNFMAALEILTPSNKSLAFARRPYLLLPTKTWFSLSNPAVLQLDLGLLSDFVPPSSSPIDAYIELGRKDAWKSLGEGQGRELTVQHLYVKGNVKPSGIRAILASYPMSTSVISTAIFFLISSFALCISLIPMLRTRTSTVWPPPNAARIRSNSEPRTLKKRTSTPSLKVERNEVSRQPARITVVPLN